jgi:hypothetical protein
MTRVIQDIENKEKILRMNFNSEAQLQKKKNRLNMTVYVAIHDKYIY